MLRPGEIIVYYKLQKGYHILLALVFRQSPMCVLCVGTHEKTTNLERKYADIGRFSAALMQNIM